MRNSDSSSAGDSRRSPSFRSQPGAQGAGCAPSGRHTPVGGSAEGADRSQRDGRPFSCAHGGTIPAEPQTLRAGEESDGEGALVWIALGMAFCFAVFFAVAVWL